MVSVQVKRMAGVRVPTHLALSRAKLWNTAMPPCFPAMRQIISIKNRVYFTVLLLC